jgi:Terminase large subunit, T4likevirus-type, N-terminal/Terminase RNaseH-like domain
LTANPQIKLARLHDGQQQVYSSPARFKVLVAGRRFGKTELGLSILIESLLVRPSLKAWWIAPTYEQARYAARRFRRKLDRAPKLVSEPRTGSITLRNGSAVYFKSAHNFENLRGEGLDLLIVDEAGSIERDAWQEVLRPMLTDRAGKALLQGTPRGRNWFFDLFTRGRDPQFPEYASFRFGTADNPRIPPGEVEEARLTLPEAVFRQEYEATFLANLGAVFPGVENLPLAPGEPYAPGGEYVIGVDLARYSDFTVVTVFDCEARRVVALARFNILGWEEQAERIARIADDYGRPLMTVDATGVGDAVVERLRAHGCRVVPFVFTSNSKRQIVERLRLAVERRKLTLIDDPVLLDELMRFTYEVSARGNVRYTAPAGYHDDCVMSLALALAGAERGGGDLALIEHDIDPA